MTTTTMPNHGILGRQAGSALVYATVVAALLSTAFWLFSARLQQADAVATLRERLAQLQARVPAAAAETAGGAAPAASPFIQGETITLAGASLQQRVEQAIGRAGGALSSSQIDLDGPRSNEGFIVLTVNADVPQRGLQALLYDLEAGAPLLFVETLALQAQPPGSETEGPRMRVTMTVSGIAEARR